MERPLGWSLVNHDRETTHGDRWIGLGYKIGPNTYGRLYAGPSVCRGEIPHSRQNGTFKSCPHTKSSNLQECHDPSQESTPLGAGLKDSKPDRR